MNHPEGMQNPKHILVGLDLDESTHKATQGARAAARQAIWLAGQTGASVAFQYSTFLHPEDGAIPDLAPDAADSAANELLEEFGGSMSSEVKITPERPWVAMTRQVLEGRADFVVVGRRNRATKDERRLGSVSQKLVHQCPAPVWVVRPDHEGVHRSVLAATDLSSVGDSAVRYGATFAQWIDCKLAVVHAWQIPLSMQMAAGRVGDEELKQRRGEMLEEARQQILGLSEVKELGENVEVLLSCDTPSHAILAAVERTDPDLVVMGTVSRGGVAGVLIGNTAERLLDRLDRSLLAVKPDDFVSPIPKG